MSDRATDELSRLREGIDELDGRLVGLLAERARLVRGVAQYKARHRVAVVDRHREDVMLARIATLAKEEGLDPRIAQQVLRTVIDAFTLLQMEGLAAEAVQDTEDPADR
jgi:monofunctional chorismate mutase